MSLFHGELRQVAYVVHDIERAMAYWSRAMGVGPWFYNEHVGVTEFCYYGKPSALPDLSIALANSGGVQVELIQQRNDAPSLYRDFLRAGGEGVQHVAYWTLEFDALSRRLLDAGHREGHAGRIGQRGRFAYFVHDEAPGAVIELSEQTGGKAEFFKEIAQVAAAWDGSDPVRRIVRRQP